jgi:hypothetical protein
MERLANIKNIVTRWSKRPAPVRMLEEHSRRTHPDAPMTLLLRFSTQSGPRTIVAGGIPLGIASDIAREVSRAGHFAHYIGECPRLTVAECLKRRNAEPQGRSKVGMVIQLSAGAL